MAKINLTIPLNDTINNLNIEAEDCSTGSCPIK